MTTAKAGAPKVAVSPQTHPDRYDRKVTTYPSGVTAIGYVLKPEFRPTHPDALVGGWLRLPDA